MKPNNNLILFSPTFSQLLHRRATARYWLLRRRPRYSSSSSSSLSFVFSLRLVPSYFLVWFSVSVRENNEIRPGYLLLLFIKVYFNISFFEKLIKCTLLYLRVRPSVASSCICMLVCGCVCSWLRDTYITFIYLASWIFYFPGWNGVKVENLLKWQNI